jgi:hypothetical protein
MRLGEKHASFAITDKTGHELFELAYCTVEGWNDVALADFFTNYPSLQHSFYQVLVAYDSPLSIFTPSAYYQPEEAKLNLRTMNGILAGSHVVSELISDWQLYNTYALPEEVYKIVTEKFSSARSWHQYSLAIQRMNADTLSGSIFVDFRTDDFTLIVAKQNKLMLAQSFQYTTPGDIIYYLLKTCHQFSLSQAEVNLQLSGLIDKQSALYKELFQYFITVEFRIASWNAGNEYPAHFFTSLNDLAQCAS